MIAYITIRNGRGWTGLCAALGYLGIVIDWMVNFVIIWIMLYMLKLSWQLHRLQSNKEANSLSPRLHKLPRIHEIFGVIFLVFSPFLFSWIPFVMHMYGISGPWCIIKTINKKACNDKDFQIKSLSLMMVMYYVPVMGIIMFVLISMTSIIALLRRSSKIYTEQFVYVTRVA